MRFKFKILLLGLALFLGGYSAITNNQEEPILGDRGTYSFIKYNWQTGLAYFNTEVDQWLFGGTATTTNALVEIQGDLALEGLTFDTSTACDPAEGEMCWDSDDGCVLIGMPGGTVKICTGQESVIQCKNTSGTQIDNGSPIYITGASGSKPECGLAYASNHIVANATIAVATEDIADQQFGYGTTFGIVRDINTDFVVANGRPAFLSITPGELSATLPTQPNSQTFIGVVLRKHVTEGAMLVKIITQPNLEELSDVLIASIADKDFLQWNNTSEVWENKSISDAGLISQAYWSQDSSSGKLYGDGFTDNGDGSVTIAEVIGYIRATNSDYAPILDFTVVETTLSSLTDNSANYIYVDYNSGTPIITSATTVPIDRNTKVLLGLVYREGTDLHEVAAGQYIASYAKNDFWKDLEIHGKFQRVSGIIIGEAGTRNISITSGYIYAGLTKTAINAFDSSASDTFRYYYRDGIGGWTKVESQTQIDNTHYDDGDGTLGTLTTLGWKKNYGIHWIYEDVDSEVFVVYGQGDYSLSEAQDVGPPSSIPNLLVEVSGLIGKIIIQKDATSFTSTQSSFEQIFNTTAVVNHNEMSNIQGGTSDEYYHWTSSDYTNRFLADGSIPMTGAINMNSNNLTNYFGTACGTNEFVTDIADDGTFTCVEAASLGLTTTKTANYTATTDDDVILVNATSGNITITLYASSGNDGKRITIKKIDSSNNTVTIDGNASETIDGDTTQTIRYQWTSATMVTDDSNWFAI